MESTKQKTFRSKSLNSQRVSIRRKSSFNKVRLLFESNCKPNEIKRHSDNVLKNKSLKELSIQSKYDSLKVIEEKCCNCNDNRHSLSVKPKNVIVSTNDHSFHSNDSSIHQKSSESISDFRLVKNKIKFFENNDRIDGKKCNPTTNVTQEPKICDKFCQNYGNDDKKEKSSELKHDCNSDMRAQQIKASTEGIPKIIKNSDKDVTELATNESNYMRSLSINSVSSLTSDFVLFDGEPEVVFRKPEIRTPAKPQNTPIPKQRTSIGKSSEKDVIRNCQYIDKSDDPLHNKHMYSPKIESKRMSARSQDSGFSDTSLNSSFLHKNCSQNCDDKQRDQICADQQNKLQLIFDEQQDEQIYEHIYEELSNCRSVSPNEWIDIENGDKETQNNVSEIFMNRRSQNFRSINNYRKSFRPKVHKRKANKSNVLFLKSSDESVDSAHSGSATEYEDIEDDEQLYDQNVNCFESHSRKTTLKSVIQQNSDHIYELMSDKDVIQLRNESKVVRELSNTAIESKELDNSCQTTDILNKTVSECEPNIYTSTPRRRPTVKTSGSHSNRDSIMSRNSSIYINPNFSQTNYSNNNNDSKSKVENYHPQFSVSESIASYLELNSITTDRCSPFNSEPLYQFYQKDVRRRAELWIHFDQNLTHLEYDVYENNTIYGRNGINESNEPIIANKNQDQLNCDRIHSICKRNLSAMDLVGYGPNRTLWCQLPQVINSKDKLLSTLSDKEKRLQESMFEIITSEASYCKSLNILVSHFYNCIEFCENNAQILSVRERKCMFSNILDISKVSGSLLNALEKRFEQNILLYDVCDILYDYAVNQFQPYIHYCAYQRDQEKLLTQLTQSRSAFVDVLQRLESNQICQNQNLLSFLMLPMQRITRYPLLIDAVCQQLPPESPILDSLRKALGFVNQLVRKCNEETKKVQRMQELIEIEKVLHFRSKMKSYPIVSGARFLVKKGPVLRLSPQLSAKKTIGKSTLKWSKSSIFLFLFSDLLILAKKKSENNYSVFDYCSRSTVQLIPLTNSGEDVGLIGTFRIPVPRNYDNLVQLILLHNHESKSVEYTISFELESEKLRWIEAMSQPSSDNPNEVIYEEWDCPQVQCIKGYSAQQTDEISLEETDVLNVFRKMKDGWFEGQRIRDGFKGWFPSNYTEEIINQHVRARNIRLRHRLLMYTQSVIEEQKKPSNK